MIASDNYNSVRPDNGHHAMQSLLGRLFGKHRAETKRAFGIRTARNWAAMLLAFVFTLLGASNGQAAIAQRGSATTASGGGVSSLTINAPTGVVSGDVMVANITLHNGSGGVFYPSLSGWTAIGSGVNFEGSGANHRFELFYRVAGSSEPSSYTFALNGTADGVEGAIVAYSGVNNTTPLDATGTYSTGSGSSISASAITTASANAAVLLSVASFESGDGGIIFNNFTGISYGLIRFS